MNYDNVVLHFLCHRCLCRHLIQLGHWPWALKVSAPLRCISHCALGGASGTLQEREGREGGREEKEGESRDQGQREVCSQGPDF